jgi:hypothetical protein
MTAMLTEQEVRRARELASSFRHSSRGDGRSPSGGGIIIGTMIGAAIWAAGMIIVYFAFFSGE